MILNPGTTHNDITAPHAPILDMADYPTPATVVSTISNNPAPLT